MPHLLIVEDEPAIADTLLFALRADGFTCTWATLASEALALQQRQPADLIILDIGLPDLSGFEACRQLRRFSQAPVLFLTARTDEVDRVLGLEIGGDDYVAATLGSCGPSRYCNALNEHRLGVKFVEPVDTYVQSARAIKYGLLFIGLTFMGFFLFEVLTRVALHPLQYALVGLALALFFLLLLSLAEHIGFAWAYLISASACVLLIASYARHALHGQRNGLLLAAALSMLYAVLYVLLSMQDYALVTGAVGVFVVLSLFMMLTRRVDWYSVGRPQ